MRRTTLLLTLAAFLLLAGHALAMSSATYRLDWFVPLTGGGGGAASSAHYAVNFTVGQSVIGTAPTSTSFKGCLGFWCGGAAVLRHLYLPLVVRNH